MSQQFPTNALVFFFFLQKPILIYFLRNKQNGLNICKISVDILTGVKGDLCYMLFFFSFIFISWRLITALIFEFIYHKLY